MIKTLLSILFIFFSIPASAQENCTDPQTQTDMNICSFKEFKSADKKLNNTYQKALKKIGDDKKREEIFRENQRIWIKYRDATCNFEAGERADSGTIWPLIMNSCMTRLTKQRTEEIPKGFMEWSL